MIEIKVKEFIKQKDVNQAIKYAQDLVHRDNLIIKGRAVTVEPFIEEVYNNGTWLPEKSEYRLKKGFLGSYRNIPVKVVNTLHPQTQASLQPDVLQICNTNEEVIVQLRDESLGFLR